MIRDSGRKPTPHRQRHRTDARRPDGRSAARRHWSRPGPPGPSTARRGRLIRRRSAVPSNPRKARLRRQARSTPSPPRRRWWVRRYRWHTSRPAHSAGSGLRRPTWSPGTTAGTSGATTTTTDRSEHARRSRAADRHTAASSRTGPSCEVVTSVVPPALESPGARHSVQEAVLPAASASSPADSGVRR